MTTKELSTNAKVAITAGSEKNGTPLDYTAYVYFGDDDVSKLYAVKQHEVHQFNHQEPQRDKFLQVPFENVIISEDGLLKRLGQTINELF